MGAFVDGEDAPDVARLDACLAQSSLVLPPIVLTELLSNRFLPSHIADRLLALPLLATADGYWQRAGVLHARVLSHGLKARIADALVAQSCLDQDVPLIARDGDFRHFARHGGLKLLR